MRTLITVIVLGIFGAAMAGCHASASVGDNDDTRVKKTTEVRSSDGDRTVKTETTIRKE
jgi:hypothetical protein